MQAMSLVVTDGDGEQNEMRMLQDKLAATMKVVTTLTTQLTELKEQVLTQSTKIQNLFLALWRHVASSALTVHPVPLQMTEQRKRRQRMGFVDVQAGASAALPPSAAGGNHQIIKT